MGNRKIRLWSVLALFVALLVTILPVLQRIEFRRENGRQLAVLEARVDSMGEKQLERQRNLARWYNYQLALDDPALTWAYSNILDFGDGAMAVLEVQELNLRMPIFHGTEGSVGHDPETPFPIGGRGNHTVLILKAECGWEEGMIVYIVCLGERLAYQVESVQVMPSEWSAARPTQAGQDLLTLIFDSGDTRTLIRCVRCSNLTVRPMEQTDYRQVLLAAISPMLFFILALCAKMRVQFYVQRLRLFGFFHKNRRKANLF